MEFEVGDRVVMTSRNQLEQNTDAFNIPVGATGTVVQEQLDGDDVIAINWDEEHSGELGTTYCREFYDHEDETYVQHPNVWFVETDAIILVESVNDAGLSPTERRKQQRILTKIKIIDDKVKSKTLRLRSVKPISFPDKKVPV